MHFSSKSASSKYFLFSLSIISAVNSVSTSSINSEILSPITDEDKSGETDFINESIFCLCPKPQWAVEVKWSNKPFANPSSELKSLETFMKTNGLTHAIVTSITEMGKKEMPYGILQFMPAACYAYTVGENTLKATKESFGL